MLRRQQVLHGIFLDLHKACDAMDRERALDILREYGVGPRTIRLLRSYWHDATMVARASGYYGDPFKAGRGVTQGGPLSPTLLGAIQKSNALTTVQASAEGFSGVGNKIDKCKDMIQESRSFAENCDGTIASFMGVWDLDSAMGHLVEMMRLVKLGEMMKQFAQEIKKLIRANIAVMEAVMQKIKEIDVIPDNVEDVVALLPLER